MSKKNKFFFLLGAVMTGLTPLLSISAGCEPKTTKTPDKGDSNSSSTQGGSTSTNNQGSSNSGSTQGGSSSSNNQGGTNTGSNENTPSTPSNETLASQISNAAVAAFVREHGAYNLFRVSESTDWAKMIEHLNNPDERYGLQFWYYPQGKVFGARVQGTTDLKDGVVFESVSDLFTNVSPAVTDSKYHTTKSGYPNTNLKATYDPSTGLVTIKYYLVEIGSDGKAVSQTEKFGPYTSTFTVPSNSLDSSSNNNENSSSNSNNNPNASVDVYNPTIAGNLVYQPSDYYSSLEGKSGAELMSALVQLQSSKHEQGDYTALKTFYTDTNAFKDLYFENDGTLLDIYSENPNGQDPYTYATYVGGNAGKTEGLGTNREHLIPQAWFNKVDKMRNDPFHVWPTDIKVNGWRDNDPHDNVTKVTLTTKNGSKQGNNSDVSFRVFEPVDAFKGDIARAYLYFAFTYANEEKYKLNGAEVFQSQAPYLKNHFLDTYLAWNAIDPVSKWDIDRNNLTSEFTMTKRRNPFIDYPNLAENLFNGVPFVNKGILVDIQ
ncbi:endonuclease [Mycoplasmopsis glycophila]|uniref:Extracellular ribonuclease n=1 Tax=Mycoplasmopsis glycophila TaxID=171285 RepID=A0A449AW00_9BACT|nr:endonuclease [Mycoplasmopsis glycophila]VEU70776.1 Extracellular ribonuclease precursor [Mycoplasmopsis glycophila]